MTPQVLIAIGSYLLGSLNFATALVRLFHGADVRTMGSGNPGATNVLRTVGKELAAVTLLLDVLKGVIPVVAMRSVTSDPAWMVGAGLLSIVGHLFPVWFGFRGGKGVATALGVFVVLSPLTVLALTTIFAVVVFATRIVSLGSVVACVLLPVVAWLLHAGDAVVTGGVATACLLVVSHRANLGRLLAGTERRLRRKDPD